MVGTAFAGRTSARDALAAWHRALSDVDGAAPFAASSERRGSRHAHSFCDAHAAPLSIARSAGGDRRRRAGPLCRPRAPLCGVIAANPAQRANTFTASRTHGP